MVEILPDCWLLCSVPFSLLNFLLLHQVGNYKAGFGHPLLWVHGNCFVCFLCLDGDNWLLRMLLVCTQDLFLRENWLIWIFWSPWTSSRWSKESEPFWLYLQIYTMGSLFPIFVKTVFLFWNRVGMSNVHVFLCLHYKNQTCTSISFYARSLDCLLLMLIWFSPLKSWILKYSVLSIF